MAIVAETVAERVSVDRTDLAERSFVRRDGYAVPFAGAAALCMRGLYRTACCRSPAVAYTRRMKYFPHIHTKSVKHLTGPAFITYVGEPGIMGVLDVAKDLQVALSGLDASQIAVAPGLYLPQGVTLKFGARFTVLSYESESPV